MQRELIFIKSSKVPFPNDVAVGINFANALTENAGTGFRARYATFYLLALSCVEICECEIDCVSICKAPRIMMLSRVYQFVHKVAVPIVFPH